MFFLGLFGLEFSGARFWVHDVAAISDGRRCTDMALAGGCVLEGPTRDEGRSGNSGRIKKRINSMRLLLAWFPL